MTCSTSAMRAAPNGIAYACSSRFHSSVSVWLTSVHRNRAVEQSQERTIEQGRVGWPDGVVAEQQRLTVEGLRGQGHQLRIGQDGDPANQRVAVVQDELRADITHSPVQGGEHI